MPKRLIIKGLKLKRFQKILLRNPLLSPTEVAMRVYNCKDRGVARVIGSQCLTKLNIKFQDLLDRIPGMSDEDDLENLVRLKSAKKQQSCDIYVTLGEDGKPKFNENSNDFIEVDDNPIQLNATRLSLQVKGHLKEKIEHSGTVGHEHFFADIVRRAAERRKKKQESTQEITHG
jgi:hypothetical protein